jgi:hypothetical protein
VLISDDVWNSALLDFAAEVGHRPTLIRRWDEHDAVGLICKRDDNLPDGRKSAARPRVDTV